MAANMEALIYITQNFPDLLLKDISEHYKNLATKFEYLTNFKVFGFYKKKIYCIPRLAQRGAPNGLWSKLESKILIN